MSSFTSRLSRNWKSGLTVALVSIPLSISLAIASQATPIAGIITAIWAAITAAFFGSSHYNIIGPTGALSGLLASYALTCGSDSLPTLALVVGFFVLIAYYFRLERFIHYIPEAVIHGFTLGVACIIALNQINFALSLYGLHKHESILANVVESLQHANQASIYSLLIFIIFLAVLLLIQSFVPHIPSIITVTIPALIIGYGSYVGFLPFVETLGTRFGQLSMQLVQMPTFKFSTSLLISGMAVALVAIIETLLSAKIADRMTRTKHNDRKELLGLGLSNIVSGLVGGIPATAALARTALNIKTGGNNKLSQGLCGVFVALISLFLFNFFTFMPMAIIAAMLVFVAIRMIEREHFEHLYKTDKKSFWLSLLVALLCVIQDPIIGIFAGTTISMIVIRK